MATISDVAKLAGVSMKTVSRVINRESSVRPDTAKRVESAVTKLNYQPNLAARNLASSKSYNIGFIYDNPNAYYVIDMQKGILAATQKAGYELIIHPCDASSNHIIEHLTQWINNSRVAGVVLTPPFSESDEIIKALEQTGVQLVRILSGQANSHQHIAHISIDDAAAAADLTQHFIAQGHCDIAFISGSREHRSTREREKGFRNTMQSAGLTIPESYVLGSEYNFQTGVNAANQLLDQSHPPTAIFACNDEIAAGALFAARLRQIDIPAQLAIAGFENSPFSQQTLPKLTTADQPTETIATKAADTLIKAIQKKGLGDQNPLIDVIKPQIKVRESSSK